MNFPDVKNNCNTIFSTCVIGRCCIKHQESPTLILNSQFLVEEIEVYVPVI
jgi:hypothetical protein